MRTRYLFFYFSTNFCVLCTNRGGVWKGIRGKGSFYHAIGMPINIHELIGREITDDEIKEMVRKCSHDYTITQGRFKVLKPEDMEAIYKMAK